MIFLNVTEIYQVNLQSVIAMTATAHQNSTFLLILFSLTGKSHTAQPQTPQSSFSFGLIGSADSLIKSIHVSDIFIFPLVRHQRGVLTWFMITFLLFNSSTFN